MRKLTFTLSTVNAVLNLMVIGIFMPDEVITFYGLTGAAVLHGSKWFYLIYAAVPLIISGVFLAVGAVKGRGSAAENDNENEKDDMDDDSDSNAIDDFLSGKSRKSDNVDMLCTWFFAVISWMMTGFALNSIENIGVIMPSIIVVMLSAFIVFTAALYSGGDKFQICGVDVKWLDDCEHARRRSQRLSMLFGVMSGMVGVCLAVWSLVLNNNTPNCIAVAELLVFAFLIPLMYSRSAAAKQKNDPTK